MPMRSEWRSAWELDRATSLVPPHALTATTDIIRTLAHLTVTTGLATFLAVSSSVLDRGSTADSMAALASTAAADSTVVLASLAAPDSTAVLELQCADPSDVDRLVVFTVEQTSTATLASAAEAEFTVAEGFMAEVAAGRFIK